MALLFPIDAFSGAFQRRRLQGVRLGRKIHERLQRPLDGHAARHRRRVEVGVLLGPEREASDAFDRGEGVRGDGRALAEVHN